MQGIGGTYGLPADCWSLGAVIYVMLVARFPEFEKHPISGKILVKLSPHLWSHISSDAKELISGLMNTNPAARMTIAKVLVHPWLGEYRCSTKELADIANKCYHMGQHLQKEEEIAEEEYAKYNRCEL